MIRTLLVVSMVAAASPLPAEEASSPLVEAAKRANRLGKMPVNVITNETLATSGGHLSVGSTQAAVAPLPPAPASAPSTSSRATAVAPITAPAPVNESSSRVSHAEPASTATSSTPPSSATWSSGPSTAATTQPQSTASASAGDSTARSTMIPPVPPRKVD